MKLGLISLADRPDRSRSCRPSWSKRTLDQPGPLSPRAQLLHAPARAGSATTGHLHWLAFHRTWGGIVAGAFFVIPSIFILWGLSFVYAAYGNLPWIAAIFYGLKPAVMAIVAVAVVRIGRKALKNEVMWTLAALAFVAIFFFKVPFPVIIFTAGLIGLHRWPFLAGEVQRPERPRQNRELSVLDDETDRPSTRGRHFCARSESPLPGSLLWWLPIAAIGFWLGRNHTLFQEGLFFSKAAVVTFGGAYAVLPYVTQQALYHYGWLKPGQMMDGLGLAETTPGPLIMVLQFVGFMGGWSIRKVSATARSRRPLARCSLPGSLLRPAFFGFSSAVPTSSNCAEINRLPPPLRRYRRRRRRRS